MKTFVMIICLLAVFISPTLADHWQSETREWRSDYHGRNGMGCCGEEDCWITPVRVVKEGKETSTIDIDGMVIKDFPNSAIHVSQDMNSYACNVYQVSEFGFGIPYRVDGSHGFCDKHTKDPLCINCVFVTGGI